MTEGGQDQEARPRAASHVVRFANRQKLLSQPEPAAAASTVGPFRPRVRVLAPRVLEHGKLRNTVALEVGTETRANPIDPRVVRYTAKDEDARNAVIHVYTGDP